MATYGQRGHQCPPSNPNPTIQLQTLCYQAWRKWIQLSIILWLVIVSRLLIGWQLTEEGRSMGARFETVGWYKSPSLSPWLLKVERSRLRYIDIETKKPLKRLRTIHKWKSEIVLLFHFIHDSTSSSTVTTSIMNRPWLDYIQSVWYGAHTVSPQPAVSSLPGALGHKGILWSKLKWL